MSFLKKAKSKYGKYRREKKQIKAEYSKAKKLQQAAYREEVHTARVEQARERAREDVRNPKYKRAARAATKGAKKVGGMLATGIRGGVGMMQGSQAVLAISGKKGKRQGMDTGGFGIDLLDTGINPDLLGSGKKSRKKRDSFDLF